MIVRCMESLRLGEKKVERGEGVALGMTDDGECKGESEEVVVWECRWERFACACALGWR